MHVRCTMERDSYMLNVVQWRQIHACKMYNGDRFLDVRCTMEIFVHVKAWSHQRTDMYRRENGLKYAEFGYPVTKLSPLPLKALTIGMLSLEVKQ